MIKVEEAKKTIIENRICASVGSTLEKMYPGWKWWVECILESGCVTVRNNSLNGEYGFTIPLPKLLNETDGDKILMRAGGEILERYRMDREKTVHPLEIDRDFTGAAIGDMASV